MTRTIDTVDSPETAEERAAHAREWYRLRIGNEQLDYRPVVIEDPVPTGRQILDATGAQPADEHLVFQVLENGLLEELRLDETTDLRKQGVERFLVFHGDRSFRFELNGRRFEWGAASISGITLKILADVDPATHGVWLERKDEPDLLIADDASADLAEDGLERFRTARTFFVCIEDQILPWPRPTITTEEIAALGGWDVSQGVIEVDQDQNERTLAPGQVIELKPGQAFGKRLCWRRGQR